MTDSVSSNPSDVSEGTEEGDGCDYGAVEEPGACDSVPQGRPPYLLITPWHSAIEQIICSHYRKVEASPGKHLHP